MDAEVDPQIWDRGLDGRTVGFVMIGGADSSPTKTELRVVPHMACSSPILRGLEK